MSQSEIAAAEAEIKDTQNGVMNLQMTLAEQGADLDQETTIVLK